MMNLTFNKADKSSLYFTLKNNQNNETNDFQVSLKYWQSYVDYIQWRSSGAYIFRPMKDVYEPWPYTSFKSGVVS